MGLPLDLGELHPDWRGWTLSRDGKLYYEAWRRGFEPGELAALPYTWALVRTFEREKKTLQAELARRISESEQAEKLAAFYRRQVLLEARLGLMLAPPSD
jgi:hypothetical protein